MSFFIDNFSPGSFEDSGGLLDREIAALDFGTEAEAKGMEGLDVGVVRVFLNEYVPLLPGFLVYAVVVLCICMQRSKKH